RPLAWKRTNGAALRSRGAPDVVTDLAESRDKMCVSGTKGRAVDHQRRTQPHERRSTPGTFDCLRDRQPAHCLYWNRDCRDDLIELVQGAEAADHCPLVEAHV